MNNSKCQWNKERKRAAVKKRDREKEKEKAKVRKRERLWATERHQLQRKIYRLNGLFTWRGIYIRLGCNSPSFILSYYCTLYTCTLVHSTDTRSVRSAAIIMKINPSRYFSTSYNFYLLSLFTLSHSFNLPFPTTCSSALFHNEQFWLNQAQCCRITYAL